MGSWTVKSNVETGDGYSDISIEIKIEKKIKLPNAPQTATAQIAVDSKYWLYINGMIAVFEGGIKHGSAKSSTYYEKLELAKYLKRAKTQSLCLYGILGKAAFHTFRAGRADCSLKRT